MNWDIVQGNWTQWKGRLKEKWGDFTDDDIQMLDGRKDQLAGKIQERYGVARDQAEREIEEWTERFNTANR